jgi:signal transduction histidine kinase
MSLRAQRWSRAALVFGAWTLLGLFISSQEYVVRARLGRPVVLAEAFAGGMGLCWLWALATPLILWLAARFPLERQNWLRNVLVHVLAGTVLSISLKVAHEFLLYEMFYRARSDKPFSAFAAAQSLYPYFDYWILIYWFILVCLHATSFYNRYREKELRAAQLESQLAQAQLLALRSQLNPHFLFNTLHAISTLMHRDVRTADRMISQLSDLLRLSLEIGGAPEVPLKTELEFVERYLEIQRARFPDRLQVEIHAQPEALDALVPNFILQPLVENAVRHGVATRSSGGCVSIRARRDGAVVVLEVRDNGPGFPAGFSLDGRAGLGLVNTRERLKQLYAHDHCFTMINAKEGGACVTIAVPYRAAALSPEEQARLEIVARRARHAGDDEEVVEAAN